MQVTILILELHDYTIWDTTPNSYILTTDFDTQEFRLFEKAYRLIKKNYNFKGMIPQKHTQENIWIVKPVNLNQVNFLKLREEVSKSLTISEISNYFCHKSLFNPNSWYRSILRNRYFTINGNSISEFGWLSMTNSKFIFTSMVTSVHLQKCITPISNFFKLSQKSNVHLTNNCL